MTVSKGVDWTCVLHYNPRRARGGLMGAAAVLSDAQWTSMASAYKVSVSHAFIVKTLDERLDDTCG